MRIKTRSKITSSLHTTIKAKTATAMAIQQYRPIATTIRYK